MLLHYHRSSNIKAETGFGYIDFYYILIYHASVYEQLPYIYEVTSLFFKLETAVCLKFTQLSKDRHPMVLCY